ncbi:Intermembrane phospholipid transport system permease protein MlaE [Phycisphaerales bacterium]|nr:Intermembrane phospholipid transport system permease protein MlaE [Phycisphaerales bacterium]
MPEPTDNSAPRWLTTMLTPVTFLAVLGHDLIERLMGFGRFVRFCGAAGLGILDTKAWLRRDRLLRQLYLIGTTSIPVLAITGGFIGMILAFEGYRQFQSIGQEARLGGVINLSVVKQIGPVLAAVMLAGRVGCSLTAELGTMRVTEQLDAMRAMGSDPVRVLVVPRLLACVLVIPALTVVSNLCGVIGGFLITTRFYDADQQLYWRYSEAFISWYDVFSGLVKSVFFGAGIGLVSCWKGFACKPGAEGVGEATTDSFVTSFITIIIMSLVLAKVLNDIDFMIHGGVDSVFR